MKAIRNRGDMRKRSVRNRKSCSPKLIRTGKERGPVTR